MVAERSARSRHLDKIPMSSMGWGASITMGLVTLIIGALLVAATTASLAVIAVLLGVVMVVTGVYYLARALAGQESHERAWRGVCGVVFVLVGLALLRHLSLSIALIGLFIGFTWIIQGVLVLMESFSSIGRHARGGLATGWAMFFGVVSLIAGIVVIASPIASVRVLTIFLGIWLVILGAIEIGGGIVMRRAARSGEAGGVSVPQQRPSEASEAAARERAAGQDMASHAAPGEHNVGRGSSASDAPPTNRRNMPG
ncbi:MAG: hypothetical protein JWM19_114 [Actinomycetia bacterium]|nr:hypothetical protein [Actinomycetes bacterium]